MALKLTVISLLFLSIASYTFSQKLTVQSPNKKINVALFNAQNTDVGGWYIKASYDNIGKISEAIPRIDLGLLRSDQDFSKDLKFLKAGNPLLINEKYTAVHGKKS